MAAPYSNDLRQAVVNLYLKGSLNYEEVAATFGIGEATAKRYVKQYRQTGGVAPKEYVRGPAPVLRDEKLDVVTCFVERSPDATNQEIADHLLAKTGIRVRPETVGKALSKARYTIKKKPALPQA